MNYVESVNVEFNNPTKWLGGVTYCIHKMTGFMKIYGTFIHKTNTIPEGGELVCTIPVEVSLKSQPIMVYSSNGAVRNAFVLLYNGEIRIYGSDRDKLIYTNEEFTFSKVF